MTSKRRPPSIFAALALAVLALTSAAAVRAQDQPKPTPPPVATQGAPAAQTDPAVTPPQPGQVPATPPTAAPPAPPPKPSLPDDVRHSIDRVVGTIESAEKSLTELNTLDDDIGRLRDRVEGVIAKTTQVADGLRPRLADINGQIEKLGPAPGKDEAPEAPQVAAERARLIAEASEVSGAIKTLELTWVRARQAIDKITDLRLQIFTRSLMERMTSPLFPSLWIDLVNAWPPVERLISYISRDWLAAVGRKSTEVTLLGALAIAVFIGLKLLARRITRPVPLPLGQSPSFFERAARASWIAPIRAVPAVATVLIIYAGLDYLNLLYYPSARIATSILRAALIFICVAHLVASVLAPDEPERRLFDLSDAAARQLSRLLQALGGIYAVDLAITSIGRILYFPLSLSVVQSLVASLAFVGVLIGVLLTRFEPQHATSPYPIPRDRPRVVKIPLWFAAVGIVVASLTGYVALGRFAAQQIVMTGVIALVATLLFLAIRAFTREADSKTQAVGHLLEERFGIDAPRRRQLAWLTEVALTLTLAIIALPVLLLQWGFSGAEIRDWLKAALFGFEIGQFKISLARILIGIVLFTVLLFVTRIIQRRLRETVLVQPRMDPGIANSVDTAVGYAGTAIAAMLAISYAGLDITNLAIVAGALSVGIGFGLQSIVNNFVSGLILLIERPVKVGDWVAVGGEQGTVKRISVRSTEIETADRASLIVPNAELVTGRVLNWTHRNAMGRVVIRITAEGTADPRTITSILMNCADANRHVLREPKPQAVFEGFNASTTEYSLRVLLPDISHATQVQSDLRIAIFEELRSHAIAATITSNQPPPEAVTAPTPTLPPPLTQPSPSRPVTVISKA